MRLPILKRFKACFGCLSDSEPVEERSQPARVIRLVELTSDGNNSQEPPRTEEAHQNADKATGNQMAPSHENGAPSITTAPTIHETPSIEQQQRAANTAATIQPPSRNDYLSPPTHSEPQPIYLPTEMRLGIVEAGDVTSHRALHASPAFEQLEQPYSTWSSIRHRDWQAGDFSYFVQREDEEAARGRSRIPFAPNTQAPFFQRIQGGRYVGDAGRNGEEEDDGQGTQTAEGGQPGGEGENSNGGNASN